MRILVWHIHGGWMNGFIRGEHTFLIPHDPLHPMRSAPNVEVVPLTQLTDTEIDVVVLQRPEEIAWVSEFTGRRVGIDIPAVFVEHNTPKQQPVSQLHPLADRDDIPVIHVTHFNSLMWDCGKAPSRVIEHGVPDPGVMYTGALPRLGAVINEPVRRGRVTGTDLLPAFTEVAPLDCFGIDTDKLPGALGLPDELLHPMGDHDTDLMHHQLAHRRAYVHPMRWTSLGLSLIEAMMLAMPVIVLAATEAPRAVSPDAGAISADPQELMQEANRLIADPQEAFERGAVAREIGLEKYGITRFLHDWSTTLHDVTESFVPRSSRKKATKR